MLDVCEMNQASIGVITYVSHQAFLMLFMELNMTSLLVPQKEEKLSTNLSCH